MKIAWLSCFVVIAQHKFSSLSFPIDPGGSVLPAGAVNEVVADGLGLGCSPKYTVFYADYCSVSIVMLKATKIITISYLIAEI